MKSSFDIGNIVSLCAYGNGACPSCDGSQLSALTDPKGNTWAFNYDQYGRLTDTSNASSSVNFVYDALNRVTGIVNPQGITITFGYDAVGRRTKKSAFKRVPELLAETAYTYDAAGQLLSIVNKAGGKVVDFTNYEYDAAGNRVKKEDRDGTIKYRYDASNRLITAEPVPMNMAEAEVFIYDRNGNRRYDRGAWDYKYDAANRLLENSTYTYTHDLNGNLTGRADKNDNSAITYAYNPEQQLSEVTTPEHKVHYGYDPLGRRIEKSVDGNIQRYVYDNEDIIAILDGSNSPTETFTHGPGIDEPLILTKADGKAYYYHVDGLGSIKAITDDSNQIIETYTYKSYGEPTIRDYTGAVLAKSAIGNPYFFTARELDSESGLYYLRYRYYDWRRGAFTQEDPISVMVPSQNHYAYGAANPIANRDAFGLFFERIWDDPVERAAHHDQAVTLDVFLAKTEGMTLADVLGKMRNDGVGVLSAAGPDNQIRYMINPANPSEVIDMRHFFVIGRQTEMFGFGVEYFQLARGYYDSAFHAQDFLSNYLGTKYFADYDPNLSWRVQLNKFFLKEMANKHGCGN